MSQQDYSGFDLTLYNLFTLLREMYYTRGETETSFLQKSGGTITGTLTVQGNIVVNGNTYYIDTENLKVGDYTITLAKDNENALTSMVGMVVPKYDGTNYGFFGWDADGYAYVGDLTNWDGSSAITLANNSSLQKISTIDTTNTVVASNGVIYVYDATSHCFKKPTNDNKYYVIRNGAFVETELFDTQQKKNINTALYNLGAYDSVSGNTITRQTGYLVIKAENIVSIGTAGGSGTTYALTNLVASKVYVDSSSDTVIGKSSISYDCNGKSNYWIQNKTIGLYQGTSDYPISIGDNSLTSIEQFRALCPIYIEYKLSSSYPNYIIPDTSLLNLDQAGCDFVRDEYEKTQNLLDESALTDNTAINGADGSFISYNGYRASKFFIGVASNTIYSKTNNIQVYFYDSNKNYLNTSSAYDITTFTTPSNAYFIRIECNSLSGNIMLNKGNYAMPYQEYCGDIVHKADIELVLLWENSSQTSSFAEQDIPIKNSSNFKYLVLEVKRTTSSTHCGQFTKFRNSVGTYAFTNFADDGSGSMNITSRSIYIQSNTQLHFYKGILNNVQNDDANIPIAIYGTNVL